MYIYLSVYLGSIIWVTRSELCTQLETYIPKLYAKLEPYSHDWFVICSQVGGPSTRLHRELCFKFPLKHLYYNKAL